MGDQHNNLNIASGAAMTGNGSVNLSNNMLGRGVTPSGEDVRAHVETRERGAGSRVGTWKIAVVSSVVVGTLVVVVVIAYFAGVDAVQQAPTWYQSICNKFWW